MELYSRLGSKGWTAPRERGDKNNHRMQLPEELMHVLAVCRCLIAMFYQLLKRMGLPKYFIFLPVLVSGEFLRAAGDKGWL